MEKCVITAALTGGVQGKDKNPNIPYTPEEFAEEANRCWNAGCAVVHIHCRDDEGKPTADVKRVGDTIDAIKARTPDILINLSTAIGPGISPEERIEPIIQFKPDLASLNSNSMNSGFVDRKAKKFIRTSIFQNPFDDIINFGKKMIEVGTKPEFEAYDLGGINNILFLHELDPWQEPLHFQFVFGFMGGAAYSPLTYLNMQSLLPKDATWSVCGVGRKSQISAAMISATTGGHIRVGLEDNIRDLDKGISKGSWQQVEWAAQICKLAGREVASTAEAREILKLEAR